MANEIFGAKRYLSVVAESTWGTLPGSPVYTHIPVNDYSVRMKTVNRQAMPHIGLLTGKHSRNLRGMPSGNLNCNLYGWRYVTGPSIAQILMDWAFIEWEVTSLASKWIEWAEGPDVANKAHSGMRCNGATLSGSDESGVLELSLDLMGQDEAAVATAQTLPASRNALLEFEYADSTFTLAGSAVTPKSFSLQVQKFLKVEYVLSRRPTLLVSTKRLLTLTLTGIKNSDVYDAYNRSSTDATGSVEMTGGIVIKGLHNSSASATGTYARCTMAFPRLAFINADSVGGKDDLLTQPLQFVALKPDTGSTDSTFTWADV